MTLSSASFLFFLLPIAVIIYFAVRPLKGKNAVLIGVSLLFYAGGSLSALILLIISALICWGAGALIKKGKAGGPVAAISIIIFIALLCTFKYLNFFIGGLNLIPGISIAETNLILPAGISFFTFKEISYIADGRRNKDNLSYNFAEVLLYVSFFPQITSGPIARFPEFLPQLRERTHSFERAAKGARRMIAGLGKKLLIASLCAKIADAAFSLSTGALDARLGWLGAIAYTIQIYFDFSGYSDMAIGLGEVFGFSTPENFDYPYISASITEFWRRWHISLSTWFKDFIYIPLGGNRKGKIRQALNKAAVFLVCGLWHGAGLNFILWGAWHGLLSILETLKIINTKKIGSTAAGKAFLHIYTMLAVTLGFVLFRAENLREAGMVFAAMFSRFSALSETTLALQKIGNSSWAALIFGIIFSMPLIPTLKKKLCPNGETRLWTICSYIFALLLYVLCCLALAGGGFAPFIYAQF